MSAQQVTRRRLPTPPEVELSGSIERCPSCSTPGAMVGHRGIRKVVLCQNCGHGYGVKLAKPVAVVAVRQAAPVVSPAPVDAMPAPQDGETVRQQAVRMLDEFRRDFPKWSDRDIERAAGKGTGWLHGLRKSEGIDKRTVRKAEAVVRLLVDLRRIAEERNEKEQRLAAMKDTAGLRLDHHIANLDRAHAIIGDALREVTDLRDMMRRGGEA